MKSTLLRSATAALLKSKTTLFLNVLGLSVGIAACLLAYLHIDYELSYDTHFSERDQLHRLVVGNMETGEGWVKVSAPIPPKLKEDIPEVEEFCRLTEYSYNEKTSVSYQENVFNEKNIYLADRAFFDFFDLNLTAGRIGHSFPQRSIYISEAVRKKIFQGENPIGKRLIINGKDSYEVSGVFGSLPTNSHFNPDYLISFENLERVLPGTSLTSNWGQFNYFAYLKLTDQADVWKVISRIKETVVDFGNDREMKFEDLTLQRIEDIHFQANPGNIKASYDKRYLYIYLAIALAIFAISLINFLNLSIASSTRRIKEVGVRKVMGASRNQLIVRFIWEGFILAGIAILSGIALVFVSLPMINQLVGSQSSFDLTDPLLYGISLGLVLCIALISGLYISFFVLSFHPVKALKGGVKIGRKGLNFRSSLLVTQFVISTVMLLSALLIYQQLEYMQDSDLGIEKEQLVTLQFYDENSTDKIRTLAAELEKLPEVQRTASSRFVPGEPNWNQTVSWQGQKEDVTWDIIEVGPDFIETFSIELIDGDLEAIAQNTTQSIRYIVNEAATKEANWDRPLGQSISAYGSRGYAPIVGVTKDFHYRSMHNRIDPVILVIREQQDHNQLTLKLASDDYATLMPKVEEVFNSVLSNVPFDYSFVDSQFEEMYSVEAQTMKLVSILTGVAILLAMLGMYALLSFTIRERTKEIAIRKVLGMTMNSTFKLLASKYVLLLVLANVLGIPATWYLISQWLDNFSYRIEMDFFYMVAFSLSTFVILLLVVASKIAQTQRINPSRTLRSE